MKNIRAYGIKFQKSEDSGIAQITVLNKTDGVYIDSDGSTSETLVSRLVDLYEEAGKYIASEYDYCYWITLEADKKYEITLETSGTKNAASSDYYMRITGYISKELSIDANVSKTLRVWNSSNTSVTQDIPLTTNDTVELEQLSYFSGDAITKLFTLPVSVLAYQPTRFSIDNGVTWLSTYDTTLTWGCNYPYYDNETISTSSGFAVNFDDPPPIGLSNVIIGYYPKFDSYKMILQTNQPTSQDLSVIDYQGRLRLLDYAVEFIK